MARKRFTLAQLLNGLRDWPESPIGAFERDEWAVTVWHLRAAIGQAVTLAATGQGAQVIYQAHDGFYSAGVGRPVPGDWQQIATVREGRGPDAEGSVVLVWAAGSMAE